MFAGEFSPVTDPIGSDKANPVSHVTYGYGAQLVHLDDDGRVRKVVAAYDAGTVVNQQALQGQVEGGIVMGLGYALTEEFVVESGRPQTTFAKLGPDPFDDDARDGGAHRARARRAADRVRREGGRRDLPDPDRPRRRARLPAP